MMIEFNENNSLSFRQLDSIIDTATRIVQNLPIKAVNQLMDAYKGDQDVMLSEMFRQTENVLKLNTTLETERLSYVDQLTESMDDSLKIMSYNYFKTTMLPNFRQGWRNLEWGNMIQLYPNSGYLAARSHGKCFLAGTHILMADWTIRNVEDIYPGMEVMGMDFTPRKVLTRHIGRSQMFTVHQENGVSYTVNRFHILCLWDTKRKHYVEVPMGNFLKYSQEKQNRFRGYRVFSSDNPILEYAPITVEFYGDGSYYGFACDGDHKFLLEDNTVVHNSYEFCMAFPLWRMYSYRRPNFMKPDIPDNKNRKETCIITNTETLGKEHLDKVKEEIHTNEALSAVLNPNGKASLGATGFECENGSKLHLRGKDGFIRGLHVGAAVSDDLPDDSSIYSLEQREKLRDLFKGAITPIVEPYGYNIVDGCVTPDTLVLTFDGIKEIGRLAPVGLDSERGYYDWNGQTYNGQNLEKVSSYYVNGNTETIRVILDRGFELETSHVHPVLVCDVDGRFVWRKCEDLFVGDYVAVKIGADVWGKPLNIDKEELYQMGMCVADGCFSEDRITIAKKVDGIRKHFIDEQGWHPVKGATHEDIHFRWYKQEKRELWHSLGYEYGLYSHTKYIPEKVLSASKADLCAFLSGYFDGDGCLTRNDKDHYHISCFSVSKRLIQQIQFVLLNMGIVSHVTYKKCQSTEKVKTDRMGYLLRINSQNMVQKFMREIGFPYSGKADKYVDSEVKVNNVCQYGVPYQRDLFKRIGKQIHLTDEDRKRFGLESFRTQNRTEIPIYTVDEMQKLAKWVEDSGLQNEDASIFLSNARLGYVFLPVKCLEQGQSVTVDFSMQETHSFVSNGIISHNTPYQVQDLYYELKQDPKFMVFEYPAIFPDGRLLAPDRFTFDKLMEEKKSVGTLVFSREYLVVPISDDSTIFPMEILMRSTIGMENVRLVDNIESFPFKLSRVVVGCDFAVSGNVGADYTCYTVWGKDLNGSYYLLYIYREKGLSHNEQINKIEYLNMVFKPNEIVVENNGFQSILADMCVQRGIKNIYPFTTTSGNKKDLRTGWASLAALFERGDIRCPYHIDTRQRIDTMFGEFTSIAFRSDKGTLESISGHDDTVSSSFMAINRLRESALQIKVDAV